jgi:hypothetical protein
MFQQLEVNVSEFAQADAAVNLLCNTRYSMLQQLQPALQTNNQPRLQQQPPGCARRASCSIIIIRPAAAVAASPSGQRQLRA